MSCFKDPAVTPFQTLPFHYFEIASRNVLNLLFEHQTLKLKKFLTFGVPQLTVTFRCPNILPLN